MQLAKLNTSWESSECYKNKIWFWTIALILYIAIIILVSEIFLRVLIMKGSLDVFWFGFVGCFFFFLQQIQQINQPVPWRKEWINPDFLRILFPHPTDPTLATMISLCIPVIGFSTCLPHCQVITASTDLAAFLWAPPHILCTPLVGRIHGGCLRAAQADQLVLLPEGAESSWGLPVLSSVGTLTCFFFSSTEKLIFTFFF